MADLIIDHFSGLDHKPAMEEGTDSAPGYLDDINRRRVTGYLIIRSYLESVARNWLTDSGQAVEWREFGDPAIYVSRIAAAILGEDPAVAVIDAGRSVPDRPDLPEFPEQPPEGRHEAETRIAARVFDESVTVWESNAEQAFDAWLADLELVPRLDARQDWLREWAEADQFIAKLTENEHESVVPLGSGVFVVSWDPVNQRPKSEIYEPDVYFPVLDDAEPSVFPDTVHLVWNKTKTVNDKEEEFVRRITYRMAPIEEVDDPGPRPGYLEDDDEWTRVCLLTDAEWPIDAFETVDGVPEGGEFHTIPGPGEGEEIELRDYPTGYDFVPVVHVPHTVASLRHFGRSPIPRAAQLLDELAASDADESKNSRWAAEPPIAVSGMGPVQRDDDGNPVPIPIGPGDGFALDEGGTVTTVNMAASLADIGDRIDRLLKRLSVVMVVPEGLVGRVDADQVPSGLALTLSFTAFEQNINGARLARAAKYRLLLKMVQRLAIHHGVVYADGEPIPELAADPVVHPSEVRLGSFMPQDLPGVARVVGELLAVNGISTEIGSMMLQDNGAPIDDIQAEVAKIREAMGDVANAIADATEDPELARRFLGAPRSEPTGPDPEADTVNAPPGALPGVGAVPPVPPVPGA